MLCSPPAEHVCERVLQANQLGSPENSLLGLLRKLALLHQAHHLVTHGAVQNSYLLHTHNCDSLRHFAVEVQAKAQREACSDLLLWPVQKEPQIKATQLQSQMRSCSQESRAVSKSLIEGGLS